MGVERTEGNLPPQQEHTDGKIRTLYSGHMTRPHPPSLSASPDYHLR